MPDYVRGMNDDHLGDPNLPNEPEPESRIQDDLREKAADLDLRRRMLDVRLDMIEAADRIDADEERIEGLRRMYAEADLLHTNAQARIRALEAALRNALDIIETNSDALDGYEMIRVVDIRDALEGGRDAE